MDDLFEDDQAARTAWLLSLSVDQISRFDRETICDWLIARHDQRMAMLRSACRELRKQCEIAERAHARIAAALTASS